MAVAPLPPRWGMGFLLLLLHNWFVRNVNEGTSAVVVRLQTLRWPLLAKFAAAVTLFAHTRMYLLLIPVLAWNLDPALGRRLIVLWALGLYLANAMKNMLLLPRPRCLDGRVRNLLERMYEMRFLKSSLNKLDGRSLFSSKSTTQRSLNNHQSERKKPSSQQLRSPVHTMRKGHGGGVVVNGAVAASPSKGHGNDDELYQPEHGGGTQQQQPPPPPPPPPQQQQQQHANGADGGVPTSMDSSKQNHKSYLASALGVAGDQHERLGLPCTRTLSATLLPAYLILLTYTTYGYSVPHATILATTWALLVAFSRMYLGLHSPTDVVAGASLSAIMVMVGLVFGASLDIHLTGFKPSPYNTVDTFFGFGGGDGAVAGAGVYYYYSSSSMLPLFVPFLAWLMILAYPTPVPPSRNYAEVAAVVGCASGWVLGSAWCLGGLLLRGAELATPSPAAWSQGSTTAPSEGVLSFLRRTLWDTLGGGDGGGAGAHASAQQHSLFSWFFYDMPPWMELPPNRNLHLHSDCVKHIPCLSPDCLWMVALRTVIGLALLVITQVAAAHFFAQVMPRFTCLGPRKFQVDCMKAVLSGSRIKDVLGDLLRLHELLPNFPHHQQLAAEVPMESSSLDGASGQRTIRGDPPGGMAWLQSALFFLVSPKKMCDTWQGLVEGGQLVEDSGCAVASAVERGQSSGASYGVVNGSIAANGGGSNNGSTNNTHAKRSLTGGSSGKMASSNGGNSYGNYSSGHQASGSKDNGEIGVDAFGSYIGMNGVTDLKSAAVVVSNLLNGNVGVVSAHGMHAQGLNGVNGKNHLQASNGTFSGRVSSWRFTFTRALADLGGGAPVAPADYERAVPVYYLTYLCVGVTASFVVPFTLQCLHLL